MLIRPGSAWLGMRFRTALEPGVGRIALRPAGVGVHA
jgi:hypothetical protein